MLFLEKYAKLLTEYCLEVKRGDQVYIRSTYLAEPLLQELTKTICLAGGHPVLDVSIQDFTHFVTAFSSKEQLQWVNPLERKAIETFDCYLSIRAPFNTRSTQGIDKTKRAVMDKAQQDIMRTYMRRTVSGSLRRCLCQYPTQAAAQDAGMNLSAYKTFVYQSCFLYDKDPILRWLDIRKEQQRIVDVLNTKKEIRYQSSCMDICFSTQGRIWINSDGRVNMPSGEVFTAPVDDSVNGYIQFSYPSIYRGVEVQDIRLEVTNGLITKWEAKQGQEWLDEIFQLPNARRFGEAAIGTNQNIQRMTKNILFDEKIGGTIHMAIGQAYPHCNGVNESPIHWDMIADMKDGGKIYADGELIYQSGKFLI